MVAKTKAEHQKIENNQIKKMPGRKQTTGKRASNGGARKGSGRKLGAATKKTREIADKLAADGEMTPLEFMLETMRETPDDLRAQHKKGEIDTAEFVVRMKDLIDRRYQAARNAAPYIHPKLSSVTAEVKGSDHDAWVALMAESGI